MTFEGKLTQKQRRFAESIFEGKSATQSYFESGYSVKSRNAASVEASRLLRNPRVQDYLRHLRATVEEEIKIDTVALIKELSAIALSRANHLMDLESGQMLPLSEIPADALASISEVIVDEFETEQGIRRKKKLKMHPKIQAIESLLKISGYLSELSVGLRICETYGIKLRQNSQGKWELID